MGLRPPWSQLLFFTSHLYSLTPFSKLCSSPEVSALLLCPGPLPNPGSVISSALSPYLIGPQNSTHPHWPALFFEPKLPVWILILSIFSCISGWLLLPSRRPPLFPLLPYLLLPSSPVPKAGMILVVSPLHSEAASPSTLSILGSQLPQPSSRRVITVCLLDQTHHHLPPPSQIPTSMSGPNSGSTTAVPPADLRITISCLHFCCPL